MTLSRDETAAGFVEHALRAKGAEGYDEAAAEALRRDADTLGFFGLMCALADPAAQVRPEVRDELAAALVRDLKDELGAGGDGDDVTVLAQRYRDSKGSRGAELLCRVLARVIYEVYDLRAHRFVQDDVLLACDTVAWAGPGQDAREAAKRLTRFSKRAARATLGHLSEQLAFVHKLGQEQEVPYVEVDRRIHEFAPRIFAQRLPAVAKFLIPDEARFRFCFVLWARLRGIVLPRAGILALPALIVPEKPLRLLEALEEARAARETLRQACAADAIARLVERSFLSRVLEAPAPAVHADPYADVPADVLQGKLPQGLPPGLGGPPPAGKAPEGRDAGLGPTPET